MRVDPKQAKKKGSRLTLYRPCMNIFSETRGITYPKRKKMRYSNVYKPVEQGKLDFQQRISPFDVLLKLMIKNMILKILLSRSKSMLK